RRRGDLSRRSGVGDVRPARPHRRSHRREFAQAAPAQRGRHRILPRLERSLPPSPHPGRGGPCRMTPTGAPTAMINEMAAPRTFLRMPGTIAATPRHRRLPERVRWPTWLLIAVRAAVIVALIGGWQVGASLKLIDPFFWSQPSA